MTDRSIILVGGPDSGKTNYLARFWKALQSGGAALEAPAVPGDIKYVEEALAHLLQGEFAPRSDKNLEEGRQNFVVPVKLRADASGSLIDVVVPDVTGELWKAAVDTCEIAQEWMDELKAASGALLFVRVLSDLNVAPLDWVTAERLLRDPLVQDAENEGDSLPTQVLLCELLRFLEHTLATPAPDQLPRVAVLVTAWDRVDQVTAARGPRAFLRSEYPLFAGRLKDTRKLAIDVFGVSVVGGDLLDVGFRSGFFQSGLDNAGFVVTDDGSVVSRQNDLTLPVAWVVEGLLARR